MHVMSNPPCHGKPSVGTLNTLVFSTGNHSTSQGPWYWVISINVSGIFTKYNLRTP